MKLIMVGVPGAGKGTQADMLSKHFNVEHIATGHVLRQEIKNDTAIGKKIKAMMDGGHLVPDEIVTELAFQRIEKSAERGYILDGFPRTIQQAEELNKKAPDITAVLQIKVPDEVIVARMSGRRSCPVCGESFHLDSNKPKVDGICDLCGAALVQREDDKPETVLNRLKVYYDNTLPLIQYYEEKGLLSVIDGQGEVDEVFKRVLHALG